MTYFTGIPLDTDRPSQSASQFRINFTTLNSVYGADHFAYNDQSANAQRHRQVRLPELGAPPAAATDMGTIYTADNGGITDLYYRYDNSATPASRVIQLSCVKAWCRFDGTVVGINPPADQNNVVSVNRTGQGQYVINFTRPLGNANYSVVATAGNAGAADFRMCMCTGATVNNCNIDIENSGSNYRDANIVSVMIIGN